MEKENATGCVTNFHCTVDRNNKSPFPLLFRSPDRVCLYPFPGESWLVPAAVCPKFSCSQRAGPRTQAQGPLATGSCSNRTPCFNSDFGALKEQAVWTELSVNFQCYLLALLIERPKRTKLFSVASEKFLKLFNEILKIKLFSVASEKFLKLVPLRALSSGNELSPLSLRAGWTNQGNLFF